MITKLDTINVDLNPIKTAALGFAAQVDGLGPPLQANKVREHFDKVAKNWQGYNTMVRHTNRILQRYKSELEEINQIFTAYEKPDIDPIRVRNLYSIISFISAQLQINVTKTNIKYVHSELLPPNTDYPKVSERIVYQMVNISAITGTIEEYFESLMRAG